MAHGYISDQHLYLSNVRLNFFNGRSPHFDAKFKMLNAHVLDDLVRPGRLVVIPDDSPLCTTEEAWLMEQAAEVDRKLPFDTGEVVMALKNYDLLQALLGYGSIGVGSSSSAWSKHLSDVRETLLEIEALYRHDLKGGNRDAFIAKRQVLFRTLEGQLQGFARYGSGLSRSGSIKRRLGLSTRSFMQKQEIAHYTKHIQTLTQTTGVLGRGAYLGVALDVGVAGLAIYEACSAGREAQCEQAWYVEGGTLVGGLAGSYIGAAVGKKIAARVCSVGMKFISRGGEYSLTCSILFEGAGALGGGAVLSPWGGKAGQLLYESEMI